MDTSPSAAVAMTDADITVAADAARDLAMVFAKAADQGPTGSYPPLIVLTATQTFTASVFFDHVPLTTQAKALDLYCDGLRLRLAELLELAAAEADQQEQDSMDGSL